MSVLRQRLVLGEALPHLVAAGAKSNVIKAARNCEYLPLECATVDAYPRRPRHVEEDYVWVEYFRRSYIVTGKDPDSIERTKSFLPKNLDRAELLLGGKALIMAYDVLRHIELSVAPYSDHMTVRAALDVATAVNVCATRMDPKSLDISQTSQYVTTDRHRKFTLCNTARYLLARAQYRNETREDGATVMRAYRTNVTVAYGMGLIVITEGDKTCALTTTEWSQVLRTYTSNVVFELIADMYRKINDDFARQLDDALAKTLDTWRVLGSLAGMVLHKAHSRAIAGLNVDSPCAELQDDENTVKWTAKFPGKHEDMLLCYNRYHSMVSDHIVEYGPSAGLIPAAVYRMLPEAHGDHLAAMGNYVTKVIDFDLDEKAYNTQLELTLRELDSIAVSACAQRKDLPRPRLREYDDYKAHTKTEITPAAFAAARARVLARLLSLQKGQLLTAKEAEFFDPTGCMIRTDWRDNIMMHAKDRSMMPNMLRDYEDYKTPIPFRRKNKLAHASINQYTRQELDEIVDDAFNMPKAATDVKPETSKAADAKRLFYEATFGAWILLGEVDESIGENMKPINAFMQGKSSAEQAETFDKFLAEERGISWYFCTDIEGWSRNMGEQLNTAKAKRYAMYLNNPGDARVGEYFNDVSVFGRDKFGFYGPVKYHADLEGMAGKANTGYHLSIMKGAIGRLKAYLHDELKIWVAPARFVALIDDGMLRVSIRRHLKPEESLKAFNILCDAYYDHKHKIDRTKAFFGHSTATFLDKLAVNGELVRNWTKVVGKVANDVEDPFASWDMRVSGTFATAQGMCEAGAPVWMAYNIAAIMSIHALEAFTASHAVPSDGFSLVMPVEMGGYGGMRMSLLSGTNLTDAAAEADSIVRKLAAADLTHDNPATLTARGCARAVLRAPIKARSNTSVLRNPAGVSLDLAKIDVNVVQRAVQRIMSKVVPWYDMDDHIALIDEINKLDMSVVSNVAGVIGISKITKLARLDGMVMKVRKARFLTRLLTQQQKRRISAKHKEDIWQVRKWFADRAPRVFVSKVIPFFGYLDEVYRLH